MKCGWGKVLNFLLIQKDQSGITYFSNKFKFQTSDDMPIQNWIWITLSAK